MLINICECYIFIFNFWQWIILLHVIRGEEIKMYSLIWALSIFVWRLTSDCVWRRSVERVSGATHISCWWFFSWARLLFHSVNPTLAKDCLHPLLIRPAASRRDRLFSSHDYHRLKTCVKRPLEIITIEKSAGFSMTPSSSSTTYSMAMIINVDSQVVWEHMSDIFDIDTTSGDICADHHLCLPILEFFQC